MKIHYNGEIFWAEADYSERKMLGRDGAGFVWHRNGCQWNCGACKADIGKAWWTKHFDRAVKLIDYADDEALAALEKYQETLKDSRAVNVKDGKEFDKAVPSPEGIDYFPFQKAGILYALDRKNTLIGDEMGLGKTVQALGFMNANPDFKRALVICPASLRINWSREAKKWLVLPWDIKIVHKQKDVDNIDFGTANRLMVIINYDKISGKNGIDTFNKLMEYDWDTLIADESQYIKNPKTQRAIAVRGQFDKKGQLITPGLSQKSGRLIYLSGTPLENRHKELWTTVQTMDPKGLGESFMRFAYRYCDAHRGKWGWDFDGSSNSAELQDKLRQSIMIRRLKMQVMKELPPKRRQIIELPQNGAEGAVKRQAEAYLKDEDAIKQLEDNLEIAEALEDEADFEEAARNLGEARKVAFDGMSKERHEVAMSKVPSVVEHLNNILETSESKVIVFGWHRDVIAAVSEELSKKSVKHVIITGDTAMNKRQDAVDSFQGDPNVRVFLGNIKAAGTGLTLTAADIVLFAELSWVPAHCLQCEDRAHRIGQTNPVLIQYLVFADSIDASMANTMVDKMNVIEATLDTEGSVDKIEYKREEDKSRKNKYPVATAEQRAAAAQILIKLYNMCDGAVAEDGMGFNRMDAKFGEVLATRAAQRELTDGEIFATQKIVQKYNKQYEEELYQMLFVAAITGVVAA